MSYLPYLCLHAYGGVQYMLCCVFLLFVGGRMSYLPYLCLHAYGGVQHMLCCVFLLFVGGRMSYLRYLCLHAYGGCPTHVVLCFPVVCRRTHVLFTLFVFACV